MVIYIKIGWLIGLSVFFKRKREVDCYSLTLVSQPEFFSPPFLSSIVPPGFFRAVWAYSITFHWHPKVKEELQAVTRLPMDSSEDNPTWTLESLKTSIEDASQAMQGELGREGAG